MAEAPSTGYHSTIRKEAKLEIALLLAVVFFALVGTAVWFAMRDPPAPTASSAASASVADLPTAPPEPAPAPRIRTLFDLAEDGEVEEVCKLVDENPERVHLRDETGWTALHHAAYRNHPDLIKALLERGADANAVAEGECVPIHMVATDGSPEALKCLVEGGAEIYLPDDTGATALHFATLNGRADLVEALLASDAPANMKDAQQETALDLARRMGNDTIAAAIEGAGGKPGSEVKMKDVLATLPEGAAARQMVPRAFHLDANDPRYQASVDAAKASLPAFLKALEDSETPVAAVKFAVRGKGVIEYVWGEIIQASDPFKVALLSPPTAVDLHSDTLDVAHDEVVDWQLKLDEDRSAGGYGQRATFEAIREEYGFLPDDVEEDLAHLVDL